ncbi:alpha/beta fold hydrolase [Nesterenkonia flava]|uniref:Alpha/beta fold hydrolase n=1 Tax=Nesterenkonia flava TaxID=469799 RepID=A0ABU1FTW4_9MICC|nr:alpha/beta fold hydrolase [Nesterenkonia flava]MDR5711596.1 alpha/beta fold hydrolase [Nesterenkonia flava]
MSAESFTLNTQQVGDDDGAPVVFLHGLFGQGKNFTQIAKSLQPEFRSVLMDLPNHGASDWTESFDYVEHADLVADHLRAGAASSQPVHLVGHSMGGKIAMLLALRHPELVRSLVVVDMSPVVREDMSEFDHLLSSLRGLDLESLESRSAADEQLKEPIRSSMVRGFLLQSLTKDSEGFRWKSNLTLLHENLAAIGGWPEGEGTPYEGPVLWVAGANSDYVQEEYAPAMRALFPRVFQTTIKNAGHWVHSEQPQVFSEVLKRFLTGQEK